MSGDRRLGVDALLLHAAEVARRRKRVASSDQWIEHRYQLLREALGVSIDVLDEASRRSLACKVEGALLGVDLIVTALADLHDPFASFLEAPEPVIRMYQKHAGPIRDGMMMLEAALLAAGRDALEEGFPGIGGRSTSEEALYAAGLARPRPRDDDFDDW